MNDVEFSYHFPFKQPRPKQRLIIEAIIKAFKTKNNIILDCPTGIGKSVIAFTVASYLEEQNPYYSGSYVLTSMKGLQDQYINDFQGMDKTIHTVKGANNYRCDLDPKLTCDVGVCKNKGKKMDCPCEYPKARLATYTSDVGVLNYKYFLSMGCSGEAGEQFQKKRNLLICDEAHNVEGEILDHSAVDIQYKEFKELELSIPKMPPLKASDKELYNWFVNKFYPAISYKSGGIEQEISEVDQDDKKQMKTYYSLKKISVFYKNLIAQSSRLIEQVDKGVKCVIDRNGFISIRFKLIKAESFAEDMLFKYADKKLFMSATILDKEQFCKSLNIDIKDTVYIKTKTLFPVERRPLVNCSVARLSMATLEQDKYVILDKIKQILDRHPNERGIIHSQTYKLAEFVRDNIKSNRIVLPRGKNRDKDIKDLLADSSQNDSVLISPSMKEGYDLKDDYARFSILMKCPYPSLGDKWVKTRAQLDPQWYQAQTIRDLMQTTGRSVRSETDYCVTYILDENIIKLIIKNRKYFPQWWLDSLIMENRFKWVPEQFK